MYINVNAAITDGGNTTYNGFHANVSKKTFRVQSTSEK